MYYQFKISPHRNVTDVLAVHLSDPALVPYVDSFRFVLMMIHLEGTDGWISSMS